MVSIENKQKLSKELEILNEKKDKICGEYLARSSALKEKTVNLMRQRYPNGHGMTFRDYNMENESRYTILLFDNPPTSICFCDEDLFYLVQETDRLYKEYVENNKEILRVQLEIMDLS